MPIYPGFEDLPNSYFPLSEVKSGINLLKDHCFIGVPADYSGNDGFMTFLMFRPQSDSSEQFYDFLPFSADYSGVSSRYIPLFTVLHVIFGVNSGIFLMVRGESELFYRGFSTNCRK